MTSIGSDAFTSTAWETGKVGLVYAGKVAYKYYGTMPADTHIAIAEGTLGIAGGAFDRCTNLKSITIPNTVSDIGDIAFYNCKETRGKSCLSFLLAPRYRLRKAGKGERKGKHPSIRLFIRPFKGIDNQDVK